MKILTNAHRAFLSILALLTLWNIGTHAARADDIEALRHALQITREQEPLRHQQLFEAQIRHFYALENQDYHALTQAAARLSRELQNRLTELSTEFTLEPSNALAILTEIKRAELYIEQTQDLIDSVRELQQDFGSRCDLQRISRVRAHFDPFRNLTLHEVPTQTILNYEIGIQVTFQGSALQNAHIDSSVHGAFHVGAAVASAGCSVLNPLVAPACGLAVEGLGALVSLFGAVQRKQESAQLLREIYNAKINAYAAASAAAQSAALPICQDSLDTTLDALTQWSGYLLAELDRVKVAFQVKLSQLIAIDQSLAEQTATQITRWSAVDWAQIGLSLSQTDQRVSLIEANQLMKNIRAIDQLFAQPLAKGAASQSGLADSWIQFYEIDLVAEPLYPLHPGLHGGVP